MRVSDFSFSFEEEKIINKKIIKNAVFTSGGCIVDHQTGEVSDKHGIFITHEESKRRKIYFDKEQLLLDNKLNTLKKQNDELKILCGINNEMDGKKIKSNFIWTYFNEQQMLFPELKAQDICKLIFVSTYSDYKNKLVLNNNPLKKDSLRKLMNLNRSVYNPWLEKMLKYKYLNFVDDNIFVNKDYFGRGKLLIKDNIKASRLFIDIIRELYHNLSLEDHNKMGLVLRLIPYINPYFNCLSLNPYETDKEKLKPLKLGSLSDMLGYTEQHCRRLGNEILSIRFGADKKRIAIAIALDNLDPKNYILMFNSKLFFGGDATQYCLLNNMFDDYQPCEIFEITI